MQNLHPKRQNFFSVLHTFPSSDSSHGSLAPWRGFSGPVRPGGSKGKLIFRIQLLSFGGKKRIITQPRRAACQPLLMTTHFSWDLEYLTICFVPSGRKSELPAEWAVPTSKQKCTSDPALTLILPDTQHHQHSLNIVSSRWWTSPPCCASFLTSSAPSHAKGERGETAALDPRWVSFHNQADELGFVFHENLLKKTLSHWWGGVSFQLLLRNKLAF